MEKDIQHQIKRWLQGEESPFEQIFHYYYPRLYRYALRYIKSEFWAEELSMEVLARVWEKRSSIKTETFENYLFTAARNHLVNHWQRKVDDILSLDNLSVGSSGIEDTPSSSAYDPVLTKELEAMYDSSLSDLPPQRRQVFLLHRNEHLSYKEIAQKLNISPKTVENHIGAALKQLRVTMLQYLNSIIL